MRLVWLAVLLVAIIAVQLITLREAFAATSPGTLIQLATSRPAYVIAGVPLE
jgi:hypothetical protein